jgi:hypothetical protein
MLRRLTEIDGWKACSRLWGWERGTEGGRKQLRQVQYLDLRSRRGWIEGAALRSPTTVLVGREGIVQRLTGQIATADSFDLMGAQPTLGRFFGPAEVDPGPGHVVFFSQTRWENESQGDSHVLANQLVFGDGVPCTVIGVAPRFMEALDHRASTTRSPSSA